MGHKIIINIGRQFGSGGKAVARILGEKLGIPVYDNEIITEAARESGFSRELFEQSDDKKRPLSLSSLFSASRYGHFNDNYINGKDQNGVDAKKGKSDWGGIRVDEAIACVKTFKAKNGTGIEEINTEKVVSDHNAPIYNMNGVQVKNLKKGIYVKQGKKFVVK